MKSATSEITPSRDSTPSYRTSFESGDVSASPSDSSPLGSGHQDMNVSHFLSPKTTH